MAHDPFKRSFNSSSLSGQFSLLNLDYKTVLTKRFRNVTKVIFQSKNRLRNGFDLKKAFKDFLPILFTNSCVVIATLLIMEKLNATSMFGPENI